MKPFTVALKVATGIRPQRPLSEECMVKLSDQFWSLIEACWSQEGSNRPTMAESLSMMNIIQSDALSSTSPRSVIHTAARLGRVEEVRLMIQNETSLRSTDERGRTALHYAASRGHMSVARLLLNHGADIRLVDNRGDCPLRLAIRHNRFDIAHMFVESAGQPADGVPGSYESEAASFYTADDGGASPWWGTPVSLRSLDGSPMHVPYHSPPRKPLLARLSPVPEPSPLCGHCQTSIAAEELSSSPNIRSSLHSPTESSTDVDSGGKSLPTLIPDDVSSAGSKLPGKNVGRRLLRAVRNSVHLVRSRRWTQ
jgi:uncharacterized protein